MTGKRAIILGPRGQLGRELIRGEWPEGWQVVGLGREQVDLRDPEAIASALAQPCDVVINAAAYTAVDAAEADIVTAWQVNALAPAALAAHCAKANVPLLHVSTDYVFSGARSGEWEVDDQVAPLGVYGASKLGGELAIRTSGARHAVVRTSWVVSPEGSNFLKTMLRLAADRDAIRIVADQQGRPTIAKDLAEALVTIATRMTADAECPGGVFHFSNAGTTTCADFARGIFQESAKRGGPVASVEPISTADFPTKARRPANSALSTRRIEEVHGIVPRPWQIALGEALDELIGSTQ